MSFIVRTLEQCIDCFTVIIIFNYTIAQVLYTICREIMLSWHLVKRLSVVNELSKSFIIMKKHGNSLRYPSVQFFY